MFLKRNTDFNELVVWWDENPDFSKESEADLAFFIHDYEKRGDYHIKFWTSTFNLSKPLDEIFNQFNSTRKKSVRRALETCDLSYEHFDSANISDELICEIVSGYNAFAAHKNLRPVANDFFEKMNADKKLGVTFIKYKNQRVSCYIYYVGEDTVRQYIKYSYNIEIEPKISELVSAFHIYKDIDSFKCKGFKQFDFGGLYQEGQDTNKVQGIINFKRSFGGEEIQLWKNVKILSQRGQEAYDKFFKKRA